ncbi:MAG: peptide-methionine (S)-S-oxide reductase MsrA [Nanoarchaeota archaeon]
MEQKTEKATFGAGCFWQVQYIFSELKGVIKAESGYMGDSEFKNPTYEQVCSGETNHAEVVQVVFYPKKVSYNSLLEIFWKNHNPTELNRQGPDIGSQYRSVVFYHTKEQEELAEKSKKDHQKSLSKKIVTQILPAQNFYKAEEYHQDYLKKHNKTYCHI